MIFKYIGKTTGGNACLLTSPIAFDALEGCDDISADYFKHKSSGWCGADKLERTLESYELALTGKEITLEKPLEFNGTDYDCGHESGWTVWVATICETKSIVKKEDDIRDALELVKMLHDEMDRVYLVIDNWKGMLNGIEKRVKRATGESR